jgi:hypothetical protein
VAQLPPKFVERLNSARFAAFFLSAVQAAELDSRAPCRLLRRNARSHQIGHVLLDVESEFLRHAPFKIVA